MRQKTQTDRTRPSLCHAAAREPGDSQPDSRPARHRADATPASTPVNAHNFLRPAGSKFVGAAFEARALEFLQRQRLRFVARNVLCRGGEIDLVMRERDGALVFVEVRARAQRHYGGAAASIGWHKKQRLVRAARHYLATRSRHSRDEPACRFDVIAFEAGRLVWLRDAFRADEV
ncbi:YraN family protein [Paraburkholderia sp. IMGN_8]|uniref:YraN family protein n=1 Tax=Paraburkholderia sp. IMGN_8 TaxID=3136564 RepID=UPI003100C74F